MADTRRIQSQFPVDWEALKPFLPPVDHMQPPKPSEWTVNTL